MFRDADARLVGLRKGGLDIECLQSQHFVLFTQLRYHIASSIQVIEIAKNFLELCRIRVEYLFEVLSLLGIRKQRTLMDHLSLLGKLLLERTNQLRLPGL